MVSDLKPSARQCVFRRTETGCSMEVIIFSSCSNPFSHQQCPLSVQKRLKYINKNYSSTGYNKTSAIKHRQSRYFSSTDFHLHLLPVQIIHTLQQSRLILTSARIVDDSVFLRQPNVLSEWQRGSGVLFMVSLMQIIKNGNLYHSQSVASSHTPHVPMIQIHGWP